MHAFAGYLSMQTSAHTQANWPDAEYTGTLLHAAEARTTVLDIEGTAVPTLCMEVELDNAICTHLLVEQFFPTGHFSQCQAASKRLKKGARVTVQAPLVGMRLVARNATHIHIHPQEQAA